MKWGIPDNNPEDVWSKIREYSPGEAQQLVDWTVSRIKHNTMLVASRLEQMGFEFFLKPGYRTDELAKYDDEALERMSQTLKRKPPLLLETFYREIGCIAFNGRAKPQSRISSIFPTEHVSERVEFFTPIDTNPLPIALPELEEMLEDLDEDQTEGVLGLSVFSDGYHMGEISGGPPLCVLLSDTSTDPQLYFDIDTDSPAGLTFLQYLRLGFRYGGFFGLTRQGELPSEVMDVVRELNDGVLPF